jgi:pimeloyl-ACP methyl ester carboxylesterase
MTALASRILVLAALGYVAVCLLVFIRQRAMMFHPTALSDDAMGALAKETGMSRWTSADGQPLGWTAPGDPADVPVLIFQGNTGHALERLGLIEHLRTAGARGQIFILDYPGYGSRPGTPSERSLTKAAIRALDAMSGPVIVAGESLGTGVAAQAAKIRPDKIRGLLLVTPFDSMSAAAAHHYPWFPVRLLLLDRFDSVKALKSFAGPVAIIFGTADETTPPDGARRLFASLTGPKKLWEVPGTGHNDATSNLSDAEWREIWGFLTTGR